MPTISSTSLPPSTDPSGHPVVASGNVLDASAAFAARHLPVGTYVHHRVHGEGTVVECAGHTRTVEFKIETTKRVEELTPEEIPEDADLETLLSVSWWHHVEHLLPVRELHAVPRPNGFMWEPIEEFPKMTALDV